MDATSRDSLWQQFGGTIDMLENAIRACPEDLWRAAERQPQFWHIAFHTLFYLDFYLSDSGQGFAPPAPFTLSELDPMGVLPERVLLETGTARVSRTRAPESACANRRSHGRQCDSAV